MSHSSSPDRYLFPFLSGLRHTPLPRFPSSVPSQCHCVNKSPSVFMSEAPPPYTQQPYGTNYHPQAQNPYPQYPPGGYPQNHAPYPAGYHNPNQPQVVYIERSPQPRRNDDWWLTSLLALCCGCFLGEVCCDSPCLCCVFPCPLRFR